ncbi:hypothetical protein BCR37DRAFT_398998 [Protomyces lactucae-debilis]|uniref:Protein Zds1 C-terminal domain-containing protein n=1 Tax=Protomyces lactucae-debilis TaxID=2754530 RepID=A0A1Y2FBV2_PROLT|nr:uncharacterized protein BCR37DRAFT_398998 [Protomyces lactucae-debilis]ORY81400.1 hypothetical protein BCR37DRAFT_398998 [Protomyces lactucae-debilis]
MASNEATIREYEARALDRARPRQPSDGDVEHYIDLYRLSLDGQPTPASYTPGLSSSHSGNSPVSQDNLADLRQLSSDAAEEDGFLSSSNVAQELRNLANLRRLSLDVSNNHNVDPDVPLQSFDLAPGQGSPGDDDDALGDSLYWVPAGIHPEIAPQEWQSFVQRRDSQFDLLDNSSPFRSPSLKRGLSRSGSLLSRQVTEQHAEEYRDAAPDLARRRSKARSPVAVQGFARLGETSLQRANSGDNNDPITPTATTTEDAPILVPPPGQILRRAARTGKGRGSYRKPGKTTITRADAEGSSNPVVSPGALDPEPYLLQQSTDLSPSRQQPDVQHDTTEATKRVHRKKSDHRSTQILGPPSPLYDEAMQLGASAASLYLEQRDTQGRQSDEPDRRRPTTADDFRTRPSTADEFHVTPPLARDQTSPAVRPASEIVGDDRRSAEHEARQPLVTVSKPVSAGSAESVPASIIPGVPSSTPPPPHIETAPAKQEATRPGVKRELSAASLTRAVMSGAAVSSNTSSGPVNAAVLGPSARSTVQQQGPSPEKQRQGSVDDGGAKKSSGWGKLFGTEDRSKSKQLRPATGVIQAGVLGASPATGTKQLKRVTSATEETGKESTNLFSSIFGGKKKEKEVNLQVDTAYGGGKVMTVPARPPQPQGTVRPPLHEPHFYSRFPIQLERAIYRMAHLKLGNSRRPLLHQVLLSNFMYGYLALVGAGQQRETSQPPQQQQSASQAPVVPSSPGTPAQPVGPQATGEQPRDRASQVVNQQQGNSRHVEHAPVSSGAFTETPKTGKRQSPPQQTYAVEGLNKAAPVSAPAAQAPTKPGRPGPPKRESSMNIYRPGAS